MRASIHGVLLALALGGCSGARGALTFEGLRYPVSSSSYLYAPDERPVTSAQLQRVGELSTETRLWSVLWSAIPLTAERDMSAAINEQIASAGGEGVTDLRMRVSNCGTNYIPIFHWLPIYPGCALVTITGSVVKLPRLEPTLATASALSLGTSDHGQGEGPPANLEKARPAQKTRARPRRTPAP